MSTHKCPAPGCDEDVPYSLFACRDHWYSIPQRLRNALWRAYREHGQLSEQHVAAMEACSDYLDKAASAAEGSSSG